MATEYSGSKNSWHPSNEPSWLRVSDTSITGEMPFNQAADLWLESIANRGGAQRIRPKTESSYRQNLMNLRLFFGNKPLCDIRLDHFRAYENARVAGAEPFIRKRRPNKNVEVGPCPAGPMKTNQEIMLLRRILRIARVWTEEQEVDYAPLPVAEAEVQRALTRDEQAKWLRVSRSEERWHIVHAYSVLAFATCMSTNEIRLLKIGNIQLEAAAIDIPWEGSKNRYRHRRISIGMEGDDAFHAVQWLLRRAYELGSREPHHYLFPFRDNPFPFDPMRPMSPSGIRKQWGEVRLASGLTWFRMYDTRHTAITRYAEQNTPMSIIMDMAGHISTAMTKHYTHISEGLKLEEMRKLQQALRTGGQPEAHRGNFGSVPQPGGSYGSPRVPAMRPRQTVTAPQQQPAPALKLPEPPPQQITAPVLPEPAQHSAAGISGTYSMSPFFFLPQLNKTN